MLVAFPVSGTIKFEIYLKTAAENADTSTPLKRRSFFLRNEIGIYEIWHETRMVYAWEEESKTKRYRKWPCFMLFNVICSWSVMFNVRTVVYNSRVFGLKSWSKFCLKQSLEIKILTRTSRQHICRREQPKFWKCLKLEFLVAWRDKGQESRKKKNSWN